MDAKELKFLEMFESFLKIDIENDKITFAKTIRNFLDLDYGKAVDLWEYLASVREDKLIKDEKFAETVGFDMFNQFYARAGIKCVKSLTITAAIRRAVYQHSKHAGLENSLKILIEFLTTNKLDQAEEVFKCLLKNGRIHYGQTMKRILETVFVELLKKNPAKIEMNRKLADLLLIYIWKIKTDERAMLEQRIKEIR